MPSTLWPALPGVTPATTFVPYALLRVAWKAPSRPVMPWTTRRVPPSEPPHVPRTRGGRMYEGQSRPETPVALLVIAPIIPATRVPCHELSDRAQLASATLVRSAELTQSPGSEGSASSPSPSFALI